MGIFATNHHGKSPCDGVGGFVKRYVAKRSLQRLNDNKGDAIVDFMHPHGPIKSFKWPSRTRSTRKV